MMKTMNFAIIAAGEGSRLIAEGINTPKPLITINGMPLIDRLIDIFIRNNASSVSVIVNSENHQTIAHLRAKRLDIPLNLVVKSTPGSMYSLYELKPFLHDAPFCLTTVDTVFREDEFAACLHEFRNNHHIDGLMGVTNFVDDEKPLFLDVDNDLRIHDFCDKRPPEGKYVSGGIYCLHPAAWRVLDVTMQYGMNRMRDFQRQLVWQGLRLKAFPFSKIVDIDHAADIAVAEEFVKLKKTQKIVSV
jgi:NDP-sugar pyrophosphorylase family protein